LGKPGLAPDEFLFASLVRLKIYVHFRAIINLRGAKSVMTCDRGVNIDFGSTNLTSNQEPFVEE
jgi:hypothetical protein